MKHSADMSNFESRVFRIYHNQAPPPQDHQDRDCMYC